MTYFKQYYIHLVAEATAVRITGGTALGTYNTCHCALIAGCFERTFCMVIKIRVSAVE